MKTQLTPKISAILVTEKTCCQALEILAERYGLSADHPFVLELQRLINVDDVDAFPTFLVNAAVEE